MITFSKEHKCPACNQPLAMIKIANKIALYCSYGPCKNQSANDGGRAYTEKEAYSELMKNYEPDPEW